MGYTHEAPRIPSRPFDMPRLGTEGIYGFQHDGQASLWRRHCRRRLCCAVAGVPISPVYKPHGVGNTPIPLPADTRRQRNPSSGMGRPVQRSLSSRVPREGETGERNLPRTRGPELRPHGPGPVLPRWRRRRRRWLARFETLSAWFLGEFDRLGDRDSWI